MKAQDVLQMAHQLAEEFISTNGWFPSDSTDNEDFIHAVDRLSIAHFEGKQRDEEFRVLLEQRIADFQERDPLAVAASDRVTAYVLGAYYLGLAVGLRVGKMVDPLKGGRDAR